MELKNAGSWPGDRFLSIDGHRILVYGNAQMYLERAGDTLDIVVERHGQTVRLDGLYLPRQERTDEEGVTTNRRGILVASEAAPLSGFGKGCNTPGICPWTLSAWCGSVWGT